jgi:hypothetical protein
MRNVTILLVLSSLSLAGNAERGIDRILHAAVELQDKKLDVPDDAAQKEAEKTIKSLFKDDYAKRAPADRLALAKTLLKQGSETKDDNAARYVLFREAQDLAARGGDLETAFRAVDEMCRIYATNALVLNNAVLAAAAGAPRTPEEQKAIAQAYVTLAEDACQTRHFDLAAKASQAGLAAAKKVKDVPLLTKAEAQSKAMAVVGERYEKVKKSIEALAANPESPEANQAVGDFECLALGDWEAGLPKLAKGSDAGLKALAAKDLAKPSEGAELAALGDAWWDRAEKETGLSRSNLRQRAGYWYELASAKLSGLSKVKVDKRLEEIGPVKPDRGTPEAPLPRTSLSGAAFAFDKKLKLQTIDLLTKINLKNDVVNGDWKFVGPALRGQGAPNSAARIQIPVTPPSEYDLTVVLEKKEDAECMIGIIGGGKLFHMNFEGINGSSNGLGMIDGGMQKEFVPGKVFTKGTPRTVVCMVRNEGVVIQVDGKDYVTWKAQWEKVSVMPAWAVPHQDQLFVGVGSGTYHINKMTLAAPASAGLKDPAREAKESALSGTSLAFDKKRKLETVDLLAKFNPSKDPLTGTWKLNGHTLTGTGAGASQPKVEFSAYTPPEEYDLTIVMDRREGSNSITIVLPGPAGRQFGAIFDWFNGEKSVMFSDVNLGKFLENKVPKTVVFMVRKEGVVVRADGKDYFTCKVSWDKVPAINEDISLKAQNTLGFRIVAPDVFYITTLTVTAPK